MKSSAVIDIMPIETEILSAEEFSKLVSKNPSLIARTSFIPGKLGGKSFGAFKVKYKNPIFKSLRMAK